MVDITKEQYFIICIDGVEKNCCAISHRSILKHVEQEIILITILGWHLFVPFQTLEQIEIGVRAVASFVRSYVVAELSLL
jgi:hypothetical protein